MSNKIPTAEEFLQKSDKTTFNSIEQTMIEFAKLHVKAALRTAADSDFKSSSGEWNVQHTPNGKNSILNAYPENLIQ